MGRLIIERKGQYNGALREAAILIDGQKVGVVGSGKTFETDLGPGRHVIVARMDWLTSPPIEVEAPSGGQVRVELSLCSAWIAFLALFGIVPYLRMRAL